MLYVTLGLTEQVEETSYPNRLALMHGLFSYSCVCSAFLLFFACFVMLIYFVLMLCQILFILHNLVGRGTSNITISDVTRCYNIVPFYCDTFLFFFKKKCLQQSPGIIWHPHINDKEYSTFKQGLIEAILPGRG